MPPGEKYNELTSSICSLYFRSKFCHHTYLWPITYGAPFSATLIAWKQCTPIQFSAPTRQLKVSFAVVVSIVCIVRKVSIVRTVVVSIVLRTVVVSIVRKAKEKVDGFGKRRHGKGWS